MQQQIAETSYFYYLTSYILRTRVILTYLLTYYVIDLYSKLHTIIADGPSSRAV
jgi:hypothetical protein